MSRIILLLVAVLVTGHVSAQVADSAKRQIILSGASNFRDLGGYATTDGHHLRWSKLYRSADISKLSDKDLLLLQALKITTVVDLRGHGEQAQAPDRLNPGTDYILLSAGSDNLGGFMKGISKLKGSAGDSLMVAYYSNIDSMAARYIPFFKKVLNLQAGQSLVFHCTAGKDRTGIAAALLLTALGVPDQTIMEDYLASNKYRIAANHSAVKGMVATMHLDPQVAESIMQVKPAYLNATLTAIRKRYGSVDNYLKTALGLDRSQLIRLKSSLLE